jgi:hypothetical protein
MSNENDDDDFFKGFFRDHSRPFNGDYRRNNEGNEAVDQNMSNKIRRNFENDLHQYNSFLFNDMNRVFDQMDKWIMKQFGTVPGFGIGGQFNSTQENNSCN